MGRAYEVRKASIQKTGAVKAKLYSMYAKEIYQAAKQGGTDIETNNSLKRLAERAKKDQVPLDIVKRAIDKVNSGVDESYTSACYEVFGPSGSTLLVDCLTDNVNRSISDIRTVTNKCNVKIGALGSVSYMYDHLCVVGFKGINEEDILNTLIENDIDISDYEEENGLSIVYGVPQDLFKIKSAISLISPDIQFEIDEISKFPKETIILTGDDLDVFNRILTMLDDIADVQNVYHNVEL